MIIKCITDFKWVEQNTFTMYVNLMLCCCSLSTNVTTLRVVSVKTEEMKKKIHGITIFFLHFIETPSPILVS